MTIVLPSGYITLDYIRSTGSQYIALPYMANSGLAVTVEFDYRGIGALFGARSSSYSITAELGSNASGTIRYGTRQQTFSNFPSSTYWIASCRVYASNSQMTVNNLRGGGLVNYDISPSSFETNLQLYLCAENYNKTARSYCSAAIYSVSINGYPLVPCMKADTGQPGLYDTNKKAFYASSSSTDFKAGHVATTSLPSTYIKTDYIEATGTQYIDTGYIPNSKTRVVLDFEPAGTFGCLFGARTELNAGNSENTFGMWLQSDKAYPHYGDGAYNQKPITIPTQTRLTFDMNGATTTVNETSVTFDSTTFNSGCNLTLFGMNTAGTVDSRRAVGKLYGAKIYNDGTLIRDFVPCINPSGVAGLWDKLTATFYASESGTFKVGNKHKTLIGGTGYEIKSGRVLIAGTGYDIKKGRTLIDGTGYDIKFGTPVGELPVRSSVYMEVDGVRTEFIIVHQGNPDPAFYISGGEGTWLLEKDAYIELRWNSPSDYTQSQIYTYGENTYFNLLAPEIKGIISPVTFASPCYAESSAPTVTCKIFPLDINDMNAQGYNDSTLHAACSYFANTEKEQRIANYDNAACCYFLRNISLYTVKPYYRIYYINPIGAASEGIVYAYYRPALVLPFDTAYVDDNHNIIPS